MLTFYTTYLAKTMPSSPAENAIMTIVGKVAHYLKVTERTIYRLAGPRRYLPLRWVAVGGSR